MANGVENIVMSNEPQNALSNLLSERLGFEAEVDFRASPDFKMWSEAPIRLQARVDAVLAFFEGTIHFIMTESEDPRILNLQKTLIGPNHHGFDLAWHRSHNGKLTFIPRSYRTDEPSPGSIAEIQCPGSIWGEYSALLNIFNPDADKSFLKALTTNLLTHLGSATVHHMLDNASRPLTMQFLIHQLRATCDVKFFGFDRISDRECRVIRTHSFKGLVAQNIFGERLNEAIEGKLIFDYPPTQIFDQKLPLALPFNKLASHFFPDSVRQWLIPTYLVEDNLEFLRGDNLENLDQIISCPREKRRLVLKYAGQDTNRNWGSRAIFMLSKISKENWKVLRQHILRDMSRGQPWVLQEEISHKLGANEPNAHHYEKTSIFSASNVPIGAMKMYRKINVVHGQPDTIFEAFKLPYMEKSHG